MLCLELLLILRMMHVLNCEHSFHFSSEWRIANTHLKAPASQLHIPYVKGSGQYQIYFSDYSTIRMLAKLTKKNIPGLQI